MRVFILSLLLFPSIVLAQLQAPVVSHNSGFYTDEFYLTITHPDPTVTILYTLDGSEPKIDNLTGRVWNYKKQYPTNPGDPIGDMLQDTIWTYEYTDSIQAKNRTNEPDKYADVSASYYTNDWYNSMAKQDSINVFKGVVLNVIAYKNGVYSKAVTRNYFISPEGNNRYSLPVTCLNIDPEKFFSYENGLNVPGLLFDEWRAQNPIEPIDRMWAPANFRASGSGSEIELNFTYLVDGHQVLNHGAGLRLHGNGSRYFPNRSYRLYAKSGYGVSNFNYSFFPNYSENSFKRIILRNSGNDCLKTMFRDGFIQEASKKLNFDTQGYQPSILFINGEYFGLYNIRERFDDKYFEQLYNIDVDELDFLENDGLVSEGDRDHYDDMMDYLANNSLVDDNSFEYVKTLIDPINFTDYFITGIFISNIDWPQNNNEFWRKKVSYTPDAPYGHDGRWRWVLKDLDYSFGYRWDNNNYTYDDLSFLSTLSSDPTINKATLILRSLLENESYKRYFVNRFSDILNTTYKSNLLVSKIDEVKDKISPEIQEFVDRWSPTNQNLLSYHPVHSYSEWENNVNEMVDFAENRTYWVRNHIQNRFDAGDEISVTVEVSDISEGHIKLNTIDIQEGTDGVNTATPYPWSGIYFKNVPITLTAIPKDGYQFTHWSGDIYDTLPEISLNLENNINIKANFVACTLNPIVFTSLPTLCGNDTPHILTEATPTGGTYSINGSNITTIEPSSEAQHVIYKYKDGSGCLYTDTFTVITYPIPTVSAGADQIICMTDQVTLTGTGDATSYIWSNGVTNDESFIPSIVTGEYIVTGTDINGCSNTDTVTVTVNPLPTAIVTPIGATLTASSGAVFYQWINCETGSLISGANTQSYTATTGGSYAVIVENQFGCSDTSVCFPVSFLGIDQLSYNSDEIKVYPNPTDHTLFINFDNSTIESSTIHIMDLQGKIVYSDDLYSNTKQYEINVSHLASGIYMLKIDKKHIRFVKN